MRAAKVPLNELRRVVIAASVGNIIEWYDFYIFGSLASILAVKFFQKDHPVAAFLSTVAPCITGASAGRSRRASRRPGCAPPFAVANAPIF